MFAQPMKGKLKIASTYIPTGPVPENWIEHKKYISRYLRILLECSGNKFVIDEIKMSIAMVGVKRLEKQKIKF